MRISRKIEALGAFILASLLVVAAPEAQTFTPGPGLYGDAHFRAPVSTFSALPSLGNRQGDVRVTLDDWSLWGWDGTHWRAPLAGSSGGGGGGGSVTAGDTLPGTCTTGQLYLLTSVQPQLLCACSGLWRCAALASVQAPTIPGLTLWARADSLVRLAGADPVDTWPDSSGAGNLLAQPSLSFQPTFRLSLGSPQVRFASPSRLDATATLANLMSVDQWTVFLVIRMRADGTNALPYQDVGIFTDQNGADIGLGWHTGAIFEAYNYAGGYQNVQVAGTIGDWHILEIKHLGGNLLIALDGGTPVSAASGPTSDLTHPLRFGDNYNATAPASMDVTEFIISNQGLTGTPETAILAYLRAKYASLLS